MTQAPADRFGSDLIDLLRSLTPQLIRRSAAEVSGARGSVRARFGSGGSGEVEPKCSLCSEFQKHVISLPAIAAADSDAWILPKALQTEIGTAVSRLQPDPRIHQSSGSQVMVHGGAPGESGKTGKTPQMGLGIYLPTYWDG